MKGTRRLPGECRLEMLRTKKDQHAPRIHPVEFGIGARLLYPIRANYRFISPIGLGALEVKEQLGLSLPLREQL